MAIAKLVIFSAVTATSAICLSCPQAQANEQNVPNRKRQLKEPWSETECSVILHGEKKPIRVKGRKATYEIELEPGKFHSTQVIAFVTPHANHPWLGSESDYYLETDTGIQGIKLSSGGLLWRDNLVKVPQTKPHMPTTIDEAVADFDQNVTNDQLLEEEWAKDDLKGKEEDADGKKRFRRTHFREVIKNPFFFSAAPLSSQLGSPKIVGIGIDEGLLKIEMTSQTGDYKATAWIDIKTRKATKAEFDVFEWPKPTKTKLTLPK